MCSYQSILSIFIHNFTEFNIVQNVDEGKFVDSDFYFGHVEVNNKPLQFVLVTDRYVVSYHLLYYCMQSYCLMKESIIKAELASNLL